MSIRRPAPDWPRLMTAATAAAYCDERDERAFRSRVGTVYPAAVTISGRGEVWLRDQIDAAISRLDRVTGAARRTADLADLLE